MIELYYSELSSQLTVELNRYFNLIELIYRVPQDSMLILKLTNLLNLFHFNLWVNIYLMIELYYSELSSQLTELNRYFNLIELIYSTATSPIRIYCIYLIPIYD